MTGALTPTMATFVMRFFSMVDGVIGCLRYMLWRTAQGFLGKAEIVVDPTLSRNERFGCHPELFN